MTKPRTPLVPEARAALDRLKAALTEPKKPSGPYIEKFRRIAERLTETAGDSPGPPPDRS